MANKECKNCKVSFSSLNRSAIYCSLPCANKDPEKRKKQSRRGVDSATFKHGKTNTYLYKVWINMKSRCENPNVPSFKDYGSRGISICERWKDFSLFESDVALGYFEGATLERVNNDGPYSPANCKWATKTAQANNRRSSRFIKYNGETKTLAQWIRFLRLKSSTVRQRFYCLKWPINKVFEYKGANCPTPN